MLYRLFEHLYAPFLMKKWVRAAVIVLFFGWACSSVAVVPKIEIGLDQEISMPDNSFMLKYFTFLKVRESAEPEFFKTFKEPKNRFQGINSASLCSLTRTTTLFLLGS
jgi:Niemann-Pick C1 protein